MENKKPQRIAKENIVARISNDMKENSVMMVIDYKGITVNDDTAFRRSLREAGMTYYVAKNTFIKIAAHDNDITALDGVLEGTTSVIFGNDPVAMAKAVTEFAKEHKAIKVKAGLMDGFPDTFCQRVSKPGQRDCGTGPRKLHKRFVNTHSAENYADHHIAHQNPGRRQLRFVDEDLTDQTKSAAHNKCFDIFHLSFSFDHNGMAHAGNGQSLLGGGGGEQGTGSAEQDFLQFSRSKLRQEFRTQGDGAAAAAGTAGMDILFRIVKNQIAAVGQLSPKGKTVFSGTLHQQFLSDLSQIARNDQIKIFRAGAQVIEMGTNRGICRRCHGRAHIVGVLNAIVQNSTNGAGGHLWPSSRGGYQRRTGTGNGPLGCGRSLAAVAQREPVLPFRRGEMGGGHGNGLIRKTAAHSHGGHQQRFCHGGTGTVQPQVGNPGIPEGKG